MGLVRVDTGDRSLDRLHAPPNSNPYFAANEQRQNELFVNAQMNKNSFWRLKIIQSQDAFNRVKSVVNAPTHLAGNGDTVSTRAAENVAARLAGNGDDVVPRAAGNVAPHQAGNVDGVVALVAENVAAHRAVNGDAVRIVATDNLCHSTRDSRLVSGGGAA